MKHLLLLAVFSILLACSGTTANYEVEHITAQDKALAAVNAMPLEFKVDYRQEAFAWERAQLFFKSYLPGAVPRLRNLPRGGTLLQVTAVKHYRYSYTVEKYPSNRGVVFIVKCKAISPHATSALAQRNAQNLARFIRDGQLERSMIDI